MNRLLFLFLSLAVLPLSNGRWIHAAAAVIGPVVFTMFMRSLPVKKSLVYGFAVLLVTSLISWFSLAQMVSGPHLYFGVFVYLLTMLLPYAADRVLRAPGEPGFLSTFYLPLAWVSVDAVFSVLVADQGSIAYSQFENLPLLQLASVTGLGGITFIIAWTASVASWVFENQHRLKSIRAGIYIFAIVVGGVLEFGLHRLSTQPPAGDLVPVAAITSNAETKTETKKILDKSQNAHESGARIILWSEALVKNFDGVKEFTEKTGVFIFAAAALTSENSDLADNKVVLFAPGGEEILSYRKSHLAPGEKSIEGDRKIKYVDTLLGRFGVAICADMSYSHFIRGAGKEGVDILFEPAAEWPEVARLQTAVAVTRAVENGFNLVKATSQGFSLVSDFTGRILAQTEKPSEETLIASVPNRGTGTVYATGGWLFSFLNLVVFAAVLFFRRAHLATAISNFHYQ
jgi:apolipoprotein N-acyltransferase